MFCYFVDNSKQSDILVGVKCCRLVDTCGVTYRGLFRNITASTFSRTLATIGMLQFCYLSVPPRSFCFLVDIRNI